MKTYAIILTIALLVCLWLLYDQNTTASVKVRTLESEIKHHKNNADSLHSYATATKDSLNIAFTTIRYLNVDKQEAHNETVKWRTKYENIRFKPLPNDRVRDSLWAELYPSK